MGGVASGTAHGDVIGGAGGQGGSSAAAAILPSPGNEFMDRVRAHTSRSPRGRNTFSALGKETPRGDLAVAGAPRLRGPRQAPFRAGGPPSARSVRRGPRARGAVLRRGRRDLSRLLEEPHHRRDPEPPAPASPAVGARAAPGGDVHR